MQLYREFNPSLRGFVRICDAVAAPVIFALWRRAGNSVDAGVVSQGTHHAGILAIAVMMILTARAALKVEEALLLPDSYRWDCMRAMRWLVLLVVMVLAVHLVD